MRLEGPKVDHVGGFNIVSDGIAPGSVQVPGNGQPIVLLADRQTTGGDPKNATVVSTELPAPGPGASGGKNSFEGNTPAEAQRLRRELLVATDRICDYVVPLEESEGDVTAHLLSSNLISGAVDAHALA